MMSSSARRSWLAVVALALLGLCGWIALRGVRARRVQVSREGELEHLEPSSHAQLEVRKGALQAEDPPADTNARMQLEAPRASIGREHVVHARSSVGLPLANVEVRARDRIWWPFDVRVVDARAPWPTYELRVHTDEASVELRAPGHLARLVDFGSAASAPTIELEPDALLTIADPHGAFDELGVVHEDDGTAWLDHDVLASSGRLPDGAWALAISTDRLPWRQARELQLTLPLRDGEVVACEWSHEAHMRAHAELPVELAEIARARLEMRVAPSADGRAGPWSLRLVAAPSQVHAWIRTAGDEATAGELRGRARRLDASTESRDGTWSFEALALERDYSYAVFDLSTGAAAMGTLRHSGEPVELVLGGGCVLAGALRVPADATLPAAVDVRVQWFEPPSLTQWRSSESLWNTQRLRGCPVSSDGRFEIACSDAAPKGYDDRALLSLAIEARDWLPIRLEREVTRAARHELGALEAARDAAFARIAPPFDAASWVGESFDARVCTWRCARERFSVRDLRVESDGTLGVYVFARPLDSGAQDLAARALRATRMSSRASCCVLQQHDPVGMKRLLYLELGDDGLYRCVPADTRRIAFAFVPPDDMELASASSNEATLKLAWTVGLRWREIDVATDLASVVANGGVRRRALEAPKDAQLVWRLYDVTHRTHGPLDRGLERSFDWSMLRSDSETEIVLR